MFNFCLQSGKIYNNWNLKENIILKTTTYVSRFPPEIFGANCTFRVLSICNACAWKSSRYVNTEGMKWQRNRKPVFVNTWPRLLVFLFWSTPPSQMNDTDLHTKKIKNGFWPIYMKNYSLNLTTYSRIKKWKCWLTLQHWPIFDLAICLIATGWRSLVLSPA